MIVVHKVRSARAMRHDGPMSCRLAEPGRRQRGRRQSRRSGGGPRFGGGSSPAAPAIRSPAPATAADPGAAASAFAASSRLSRVAVRSAMMPGLASANTTRRPAGDG